MSYTSTRYFENEPYSLIQFYSTFLKLTGVQTVWFSKAPVTMKTTKFAFYVSITGILLQ